MTNENLLQDPIKKIDHIEETLGKWLRKEYPDTMERLNHPLYNAYHMLDQVAAYLRRLTVENPPEQYEMRCVDCNQPMEDYVGLDCCTSCYGKRIGGS